MKREADLIDDNVKAAAFKLSKADWTELYFDLFRQVFGEKCPESQVMQDAHRRLQIIKTYRRHESA